ncbi:MAG TPA: TatD family hydrolase [Candidatus Saccharimonadales bacterium]|nr:TatD family hydrolase [Candidatus Saccharimonadales bacterium]
MLIDTHCHMNIMLRNFLQNPQFQPLTPQELQTCKNILDQAKDNQVEIIMNVGTNLVESLLCINIAKHFDNCFATIGLHPNDTDFKWTETIESFKQLLTEKKILKIVGIGECGIDKHYPGYDLKRQQDAFHAQIQLALQHNLALVIHSRDADHETYEALAAYKNEPNFKGTIHCFSSDQHYATKYMDLGFVLGIGGTVTYPKNKVLQDIVANMPLEKIIFETDAPFLPPQIIRGKPNSPAQIRTIAEFVAQLRNESFEKVMKVTAATTKDLFAL